MQKVYLAGGMTNNWREKIIEKFSDRLTIYSPIDHKLKDENLYTVWDLHFVKKSDIIFAYMEADNPSGFGLTLEIGYAKALSKTIILIDEKSKNDNDFAKKFMIVRKSSSVIFEDFIEGVRYLEKFLC